MPMPHNRILPLCNLRLGDATAIEAPDRRKLTYDELANQVVRTGRALRAVGFHSTDRIALVLPNGPEAATAFLSIAATCVCAPLNPAYRETELEFYLRDLRPKAIAVAEDGPAAQVAARLGIEIMRIAWNSAEPAGKFRVEGLGADTSTDFTPPCLEDIALLLHTSGTTSRPKLVPLTWANLGQSAANVSNTLGLSSADRCLNIMPLFHIHGLVAAVLSSLSRGASVVCTPGFDATSFFDWLDAFAPTWYTAVPAMHQSILARAPSRAETLTRARLRFIRSSSAALPVRVLEELESTFGVPVIEAYGMTEAAHQMASNPLPPAVRKPGSVGPSAGPKISVRDDAGLPVAAGTAGHVCIAGPNVTTGYIDNPKANQESFAGGWFHTGDLGWLDRDGYLFLSGRSKEIVNRGGEKISPREVEEVLMRHPSVEQCVAFALPDSKLGEEVGAAVVLKPGAPPDEAALQSFSSQVLADFKVPRRVFFLDEIPKGPTGKPQRIGLAEKLGIVEDGWKAAATAARHAYQAADPALITRVCGIVAEVLRVSSIGPDTDFFDAGGDSLLGSRFLARLGDEFHCACTLIDLFRNRTAAAMAGWISSGSVTPTVNDLSYDDHAGAALSFGQARLWFLDQFEAGSLVYIRPYLVEIRGEIEPERVRAALIGLVERHAPLRTTIHNHEGAPQPRLRTAEPFPLEIRDWRATSTSDAMVMEACRQEAARPFRLHADLLLRASLHRLEDRRWWLLVVTHHVATDGWSAQILVRELGALLRGEALDPLPVTYFEYARWQARFLSGERLENLLAYWRRQLDGAPGMLDLPFDFPRPGVQTFHGKVVSATLAPDLTARLRELSHECGVTLFMTLLAGWKALLARLCGASDICVVVPVAGRTRVEWEPLIGLFMNTLALRTKLDADPPFREILDRVRETCLQAWSHQDLPFEKLGQALQPERTLAYTPYFQVVFQLRNFPETPLAAGDLSLRQWDIDLDAIPTDLNFEIAESAEGLACRLFYNTALFTERSAARMLEHFEVVLRSAAEAPETRLSELAVLTAGEREQLLVDWSATEAAYPRDQCIHELFEQQAERTPDSVAVVFGEQHLTYRELNQRSNQLANHLHNLGVQPDDLVGICVERSLEMVVGLLGILKSGGAYVPLDPAYPKERLDFILEDTRATIVLTQATIAEWGGPAGPQPTPRPPAAGPGTLAYVMYTSGSTGTPKGVEISHRGVVRLLFGTDYARLAADEVFLQLAPLAFDASTFEIWGALLHGARLVVMPPHQPTLEEIGKAIRDYKITTLWLTAGLFHLMVEERVTDLKPLRQLLAGGDVLSPASVHRAFRELPGCRLVNGYGPTESTTFACCYSVESKTDCERPIPIGRPIANTQIYILDGHLQPAPIGVAGELCIGGDGLARGYLNRPELTAERFVAFNDAVRKPGSRIYRTGDLARYRPDGNIEFLGRMDHQVKIRGFRIELEEIEAALQQHPDISQSVVVASDDAPRDKRLVAYVVPVAANRIPSNTKLRDFLHHKLPDYMVPAAFVMLPNLPVTPNGKIDRDALPAPHRAPASEQGYVAARTPIEEALTEIWSEILGRKQVGVHDNFFELGGHSLLAAQAISRVRKVLQIELPRRTVFEGPTLAVRGQHFLDALAGGALPMEPILPVPRAQDVPLSFELSFAQERLWFLDQLEPSSAVYNVPVALRLEGAIDAALLKESLSELVRRHETLRTRFENVHGRPVQVIEPFDGLEFPVTDLSDDSSDLAEARRQCMEEAQRPFDLSQPRMLRATLFRWRPTTHILMLTMHHIAADGWSLGVLLRELGILYQAFSAGKSSPLPELPVQYADFAVWQRNWLSGEVLEKQLSYWKQQLEGAPARLELPTDRPRPPTPSYRGATEEMILPQPLLAALKALSRQEGATLFMTLLTAFQILLGRYSGQQDFTVGMPIAGRNRAEIEGLIGFFVNMLVLRCDMTGDLTFGELLRRVREALLEAYAHQDLPFEKLVEELRPERNMRYGPLCQVIFAMQNTPAGPAKLGELDLSVESVHSGTAKFDLSLHMSEESNGLRALVEYSTDLFDRETIVRLLANFRSLLEGIAASPGERIWNLPLLSSGERKQILVDWNATEVSYPLEQDECLHQLFEHQAERTPDAVAVVYGDQQLTYRELNHRSNQLAHHLRDLGVKPDDLVGICMERSLEMVVGLLGILKSGGAYVPLDPAYPKERLDFILEDAQVRVVLTQELLREWAEIATSDPADPASTADPDHPAYVIYTSGSTGRPKGVVITHRSAVALVRWAQSVFDPDELAGVLFSTSICFDLSVFELFVPLSCGGKAILVGNALQLHESPAAAEVTLINTVPSVMKELLRVGTLPPSVHTVNLAGELLGVDLVQEIYRIPTVRKVYDLYGPSETTTYSTFALRRADGPCTIGRPIANTRIYILDARMQPVPIGVAGELCIGGDGLARGYLNCPELTAEKFIAHPFSTEPGARLYRTGDLARYLPDGNIEFLGRMDHQVKLRGFRIELGEIEAALKQHPDVSQCVVTAPEDAAGDKRLVAYVVPVLERASAVAIGELRDFIKHKLPDYMAPAAFVMLPNLPVTPNGKIDRKALPEPDRSSAGLGLEREFVAPRTVMELQLAQIWERILGVPTVSVNDNFFALGGHSLLAVRVISEVLKSLQRRLPLPVFFENPTIEGMARELQSKHAHGEPELIRLAPGGSPGALFLLEAGIGLCRLAHLLKGGPASFASVVPLQGEIHGKKSELPSLEELAAAHAALVRGQQPSSPCVLAGHSIAGLLAFEAAHQLQREGRAVEMILLLDSWATPPPWWEKLKAMTLDGVRNSLNFHTRDVWARALNQPIGEASWDDVTVIHRNAWKNYKCHPVECRGVLFRARDNPWPLDAIDGCMGWRGLFTRGLEIVEVPGDHFSLLEAPHLLTLAQRFQECLEQPAPERR